MNKNEYTDEMQHCQSELGGGYIKDIPTPHIRKWPGHHTKRRVSVRVIRWPGHPHYSATIKEEGNPIWNRLTQEQANPGWKKIQGTEYGRQVIGWQRAWDDAESKGREFMSENCLSTYWIARWVELTLAEHFTPLDEYEVEYQELGSADLGGIIKWGGYTREGD